MSNLLPDAVEAVDNAIGNFAPENVEDLGDWLRDLPGLWESIANGIQRVAERFGSEYPLHPAVVDHLNEMSAAAAGQQEYASEAHGIFRASHEAELERLENPRPNESLWDVVENQ